MALSSGYGDWLAAADQLAGTGVGGHAVFGDYFAGHDRCDVTVGGLVQATAAGGQVVADHRLVQPQRGVIDDVEVGLVADGDAAAVALARRCGPARK